MATKFLSGIDLANQKIVNVADPSAANDGVNKNYVDAAVRGLRWEQPVRAASTTSVTIASPGANIDGVPLVAGDRVLLKDQTDGSPAGATKGIYIWNGAGTSMTRALDANAQGDLDAGTTVTVTEGTVNAGKVFHVLAPKTGPIGTTNTTWGELGGAGGATYTAGNGLSLSGGAFSAVAKPSGGITVDASGISVDPTRVPQKYSANVPSATSVPIAHGLGTRDVQVSLYLASSPYAEAVCDVEHTDANTVTLKFAVAPAANDYRVVVIG